MRNTTNCLPKIAPEPDGFFRTQRGESISPVGRAHAFRARHSVPPLKMSGKKEITGGRVNLNENIYKQGITWGRVKLNT